MYQYRQIITHLRSGESGRAIARAGLASRKKVQEIYKIAKTQGWLIKSNSLPDDVELAKYFRMTKENSTHTSSSEHHRKEITKWHQEGIQASTIHSTLQRKYQFQGSYDSVRRLIKKIKNNPCEVTTILEFKPGESGQVDFGYGPKIIDTKSNEIISTWFFVMVLSWSRHMYAEIVLDQSVTTWLGCHRRAFEFFNGVPEKIIIDNPKCAITKACYYDPQVQRAYGDYAEGYGFMISPCPPREPKKKGRVESGVKYVKKNFLPLREFRDLTDANQQLKLWILEIAGNRSHGSTHEKPLSRFIETEQFLLKSLPEQPPELVSWTKVKVHSDCHIQFQKCRYSVPYSFVNQILWLRASETSIRLYQEENLVAIHSRLGKPGERHTLIEHVPPNASAYFMQDQAWCCEQSKMIGQYCEQVIQHLFASTMLDHLRTAQGIIKLQKTYGNARLNAACQRALVFNSANYQTIKLILKKGLEYAVLTPENAFDDLAQSYTGRGRYSRDTTTMMQ